MVASGALPTLSVVIPSFNQRDFLEEAIRSVLAQDVDIELLVLDGGSTDGSDEVIKRYATDIAYWRSAPDEGQAAAIAEGFVRATGEVLAWLNSDDLFYRGAVRPMLEAFRDHPEAGWAVGHAGTVDERSQHLLHRPTSPFTPDDVHNLHLYLPQESTFFRRSLYEGVGGVDPDLHYAMDYDLWLKFARVGPPVLVDAYIGCFRVVRGQKSADIAAYQAEEAEVKQRYDGHFDVYGPLRRTCRLLKMRGTRLARRVRTDGASGVVRQLRRVWRGEQISPGSDRATVLSFTVAVGLAAALVVSTGRSLRRLRWCR
ncbi:hypothetical protein BH23ACT10_BH23ACT10_06910 [soil metagenome]